MKTEKENSQWQNITSFEKACERTKKDPNMVNEINVSDPQLKEWLQAALRLAVAYEAVNTYDDGTKWVPDRADWNQWKYYSVHEIDKSGGGFSYSSYGYWSSCSDVGSRLETDSAEKVYHINKHFEADWKIFKLMPIPA